MHYIVDNVKNLSNSTYRRIFFLLYVYKVSSKWHNFLNLYWSFIWLFICMWFHEFFRTGLWRLWLWWSLWLSWLVIYISPYGSYLHLVTLLLNPKNVFTLFNTTDFRTAKNELVLSLLNGKPELVAASLVALYVAADEIKRDID